VLPAAGLTRAVVLLLPGGQVTSFKPGSPAQLPAIRMRPFARRLHRAAGRAGLAAWTLHYRYQGWNREQASPLADIGWALAEVRRRHGSVPVILTGHSMGGRAALRAAGDRSVHAVLALAPWLPDGEPVSQLAGRRVLIAHGSWDRVTSPQASAAYAERARRVAGQVGYLRVRRDTHAMLLRAATWNRLVVRFACASQLRPGACHRQAPGRGHERPAAVTLAAPRQGRPAETHGDQPLLAWVCQVCHSPPSPPTANSSSRPSALRPSPGRPASRGRPHRPLPRATVLRPVRPAVAPGALPDMPQHALNVENEQLQAPITARGEHRRAQQPGHRGSLPAAAGRLAPRPAIRHCRKRKSSNGKDKAN
jgi:predicted esterase